MGPIECDLRRADADFYGKNGQDSSSVDAVCANRSNFVRPSNRCNRRNYRISSRAQCSGSHRKAIASLGNG